MTATARQPLVTDRYGIRTWDVTVTDKYEISVRDDGYYGLYVLRVTLRTEEKPEIYTRRHGDLEALIFDADSWARM